MHGCKGKRLLKLEITKMRTGKFQCLFFFFFSIGMAYKRSYEQILYRVWFLRLLFRKLYSPFPLKIRKKQQEKEDGRRESLTKKILWAIIHYLSFTKQPTYQSCQEKEKPSGDRENFYFKMSNQIIRVSPLESFSGWLTAAFCSLLLSKDELRSFVFSGNWSFRFAFSIFKK